MKFRYRDINLSLHEDESILNERVAAALNVDPSLISNLVIVRRSTDARKKPRVLRVYTVEFEVDNPEILHVHPDFGKRLETVEVKHFPKPLRPAAPLKVVVVGMGPAGLFSALRLAEAGADVTLLEMGRPVEERVRDVEAFWDEAKLDTQSNVQFGEGGAGTFSDGKLNTRIKHPGIRYVLQTLVRFGADPDILVQAKPHVGTDRLRKVLIRFRSALLEMGVTIRFSTRVSELEVHQGQLRGGLLEDREHLACDAMVLAPGHSATDTFRMLDRHGVTLEAKPFAIGLRVEHPVELINEIQYGMPRHEKLPTADYALAYNDKRTGRGVYSFCMCPGGNVINAASETDGVVVNGMSRMRRDSPYSNSALVVSVGLEDFVDTSPLGGLRFQRKWEQKAFYAAGGNFNVPAQNLLSFSRGEKIPVSGQCSPGVTEVPLDSVLPDFVTESIRTALPVFDRKMRGFSTREATLYGVETRTSSPVRILRKDNGESVSLPGLFPAGEGAGYAGGIMSAALDGMRAADAVLQKNHDRSEA